MTPQGPHFRDGKTGSAITVKVTAKAARSEIVEILGDGTLKIRLAASSVADKGNEVLLRFLAEVLETSPAKLEILAGENGADKLITIIGLDASTVQKRVLKRVQP